jgi:hypothetical protein
MTKRYAIFTACDEFRIDFLRTHWLPSLQENVDLTHIDVNVLDYGLTDEHRAELQAQGVSCHRCVKDGHPGTVRVRDVARIAAELNYDQVLAVDSGDLIFQADVSPLFEQDKNQFRAVCEELNVPIHHVFMDRSDFPPPVRRRVLSFLYDKPVINGGFLLGPVAKFRAFWEKFAELGVGHRCFCTDQMVLNYMLHQEGFKPLEKRYNFVALSMLSRISIRRGVIYDEQGRVIPVVHNAGMKDFAHRIGNFGYGPQYNCRRWFAPAFTRYLIFWGNVWKWFKHTSGCCNHALSAAWQYGNRRLRNRLGLLADRRNHQSRHERRPEHRHRPSVLRPGH